MVNKKHNNKGSAFTIVIIAMALFLMIMFIVSFQTNYQMKTNSKHYIDLQQKYLSESGIDKVIADISSGIESEIKDINTSYSYNYVSIYLDSIDPHKDHVPVDLEMNAIRRIVQVTENIYNGENGLWTIGQNIDSLNLGINNSDSKKNLVYDIQYTLRDDIWNNLGSNGNGFIHKLSDYVHYNSIKDRNDLGYQDKVKTIELYIDEKIKEILSIQKKLNELYNDSQNKDEDLRKKIDEIQSKFESVKYNLEEIKCKLGIKITGNTGGDDDDSTDSSGSSDSTDSSDSTGSSDSSESSETVTININIPDYKFPNESTYKSDGYETKELNIPITVNYTNGYISSIEPVTVDNIISIGYKNNEEYKMSASVTFSIGKEGNVYRVLSYNVNEWKKI